MRWVPLNNYQKMCYRWFGRTAEKIVTDKIRENLEKAHISIRPGAYISCIWVNTILVAIATNVIFLSLIMLFTLEYWLNLIFVLFPVLLTVLAYFYFRKMPASRARSRAKKIDLHLPYALNFISAMSSAGITPTEIFKSLSKQNIYGEIREEAMWIYRDVSLLGKDIISAIKANINRTPSEKFKEFLQGTIVTVQSGGALKQYFMTKAEQYSSENRIAQKQQIESMGIMAEAYVTAAVAGVLMLIIIIPILMIIRNSPPSELIIMYIFTLLIVPFIHIGFAVVLTAMSAKV